MITPPFFRTQLIVQRSKFRWHLSKLKSTTYFDWATIFEIFVRQEYSLEGFAHFAIVQKYFDNLKSADKKPVILDLGANVGIAARYFNCAFPGCRIICVEASSENVKKLASNTLSLENVEIHHAGIGPEDGVIKLYDSGKGNNAFQTFGDESTVIGDIPQLSIPTVLSSLSQSEELFLVKIDIEGFEKQLFSGNVEWIDQAKIIAIETHDWMMPGEAVSANFLKAISGKNRDLLFKGENLFSIRVE